MSSTITENPAASARPAGAIRDVRAALLRDFIFEALEPVARENDAALLCLQNDDDVGARYHLKRVVARVKVAASTVRNLEALTCRTGGEKELAL
jgi:hypothetical protein